MAHGRMEESRERERERVTSHNLGVPHGNVLVMLLPPADASGP